MSQVMSEQMTPKVRSKNFRALWQFIKRMLPGYRWKLSLTLLLGVAEVCVLVLIPLIGARIINALAIGDWPDFRWNLLLLALLTLSQALVSISHQYVFLRIDERIGNNLRRTIVETVLSKRLRFFEKYWVGDIVSRAVSDSSLLKPFITSIVLQIVYDVLTLAVVVGILIWMNPTLALLMMASAPVTLLYGRKVQPRLEAAALGIRENVAGVTGHLQSWLSRPFAIKIYSLEAEAARRFRLKNDQLTTSSIRMGVLSALIGVVNTTLLGLPALLIFGYGGYITLQGQLSVGHLFAFMTFASYFNAPIQRLIGIVVVTLPTLYPVHQRIAEILATDDIEPPATNQQPEPVKELRVADLSFEFEGRTDFSLSVPSLVARRGEIVGIAGANGSGKSTLARLLMGIYQPQRGAVHLVVEGGHQLAAANSRAAFGLLPQEPAIFDGTLRENVTLFETPVDSARLSHIEKELDLSGWLNALPGGWETEVNAGLATTFSGGQMQRIGLARLLYSQRSIFIFDEPANGLDQSARRALERILLNSKSSRIVIIITHSDSTLALCDRVYRLQPRPDAPEKHLFECLEESREEKIEAEAEALSVS